jgi:hypothetical protein
MAGGRFTAEQVTQNLAKSQATRPQAEGAAASDRQAGKPKATKASRDSVARWVTFNTFMDVIAPRLSLPERAVWLVMFRHSRGGVCNTSERRIAEQARIDKATAGRSLQRLVDLRLVWPVFKSSSKGEASRYGLQPRPEACLAAVIAMDDRRREAGRQRRQEKGGDRRGRRRKGGRNRVNSSPAWEDEPGELVSGTG